MKIVRKIAFIIVVIIVIPLSAALFVPRSYTVSVSENINLPRNQVYNYVRMLKNQKEYNVWVMQDPDLNPEIVGKDGSVGAIQRWNSKIDDVGEGEQEITGLTSERIDFALRFKRPIKGTAKAASIFKTISVNQTRLTSEFYSFAPYPLSLPSYLFGKKMIKEAQVKNLHNIKRILEEKQNIQADVTPLINE
jgi:hypothetical protein